MISGKQFKNMADYMFSGIPGYTPPTSTFTATPDTYVDTSLPGSIVLSGTITQNDGTVDSWAINEGVTPTPIATGTNLTPSTTLTGGSIPSSPGTYNYYLTVYYTDSNGDPQSFIESITVVVTAAFKYGQLSGPGDNITVPGDLTAPLEAALTVTDKATIINIFSLVAAVTARVVFVVPDSYGTVTAIEDGAGLDITSQFNVIVDAGNNRKIYCSINTIAPATYYYKFIF